MAVPAPQGARYAKLQEAWHTVIMVSSRVTAARYGCHRPRYAKIRIYAGQDDSFEFLSKTPACRDRPLGLSTRRASLIVADSLGLFPGHGWPHADCRAGC